MPNRLAAEQSPYLLQHQHNPVEWYPWGDEAFSRARREGKPVLLSVGYSACHWCHSEQELENPQCDVLNRHFISIKSIERAATSTALHDIRAGHHRSGGCR